MGVQAAVMQGALNVEFGMWYKHICVCSVNVCGSMNHSEHVMAVL